MYVHTAQRGMGQYRKRVALHGLRGLGITQQEGGLLSTGAGVAASAGVSSLAAGTALGSFAGPIGAGVGALVGIIAGLFAASAARAKGATEENQAINQYLPAWDQALTAIFQRANSGAITAQEAISQLPSLMQYWWQAAAQFRGLPGVADASGGGANCGTYTPGVTPACSPSGGPGCNKSCTAFCCIGCNDLMPSIQYAIFLFSQHPEGGSLNVCTVYASKYGASQRSGYTLTWTPPATTAGGMVSTASALTSTSSTIAGIPVWLLALGAAGAFWYSRQ